MKHAYLEVTYRKGRPIAAYYYLPRKSGDKSVRTERADGGLIVDFAAGGRPIGIEITRPANVDLAQINQVLSRLGHAAVESDELAPLQAA